MYDEDDYLPISAVQHWLFCPRQCGLILLEQAWTENRLTAEGRGLHDRAHEAASETHGEMRIVRGLRLCSRTLGLTGQADVVELRRPPPETPPERLAAAPELAGRWIVYPVEYKRGGVKQIDCDRAQLCVQAMCLEEMLGVSVVEGALFYERTRRRETVPFDRRLREIARRAAEDVHRLVAVGRTPAPTYSAKCRNCSLVGQCLPKPTDPASSVRAYLRRRIDEVADASEEQRDEDA